MIITIDGKEEIQVGPKTAEIIRLAVEHADRIEAIQFGHFLCDIAGRKVIPNFSVAGRAREVKTPGVEVRSS